MNLNYLMFLVLGLLNIDVKAYQSENVSQKEFVYQKVSGIGFEKGITRRDPSDVIMENDTCYVYYTKVKGITSGYWGRIWCAYSVDNGFNWHEVGEVLSVGKPGTFDEFAVFTPNIIKVNGKYYLYYTGVKKTEGSDTFENNSFSDYTALGVAVSYSPCGPFKRLSDEPILTTSDDKNAFDSYRIDDAALLLKDGKIWLYYKGRRYNDFLQGPRKTQMGLAFSEKPIGPFVKYKKPLLNNSHEVMIWPYGDGVYALASFSSTIEYACDGISFGNEIKGVKKKNRPEAPGAFRPDLININDNKRGLEWGISMIIKNGECYLTRYSFENTSIK